ncbi:hypothetical protein [Clostridium paraputrificum]|uniref:hypothetical protein n=1 Tax=Clostridium paraputrificum TaxID=29363 RepID=UPI00196AEEC0|nr:hypothetical protein [Clostridium paraputrificum]
MLSKEATIDRDLYPHSKLIIIAPENLDENTINGTLNLDTDAKRVRINEGYKDTMNRIKPVMELIKFINEKEEEEKNPMLYKMYGKLKSVSFKRKEK